MAIAIQLGDNIGRVGGHLHLFNLVQTAQAGSVEFQINELKKQTIARRLKSAGEKISQLAVEQSPEDALTSAQQLLDEIVTKDKGEVHKIGDTLEQTITRIQQIKNGTAPKGLETGFTQLDELLNGLQAGQMVIIAARPGMGKSTLAVDIMRHLSIHGDTPTLLFSLEMSADEINERVLSAESKVRLSALRAGTVSDNDIAKLNQVRERVSGAPMFIDASPDNTMADIVAKTKMMVARDGVKLVAIDYLQLLKSAGNVESRQQEVATFSRQIKLLAKSAGVPIIAVCQLNRGPENRDGGMPKASDLRESGALEQDADVIALIHRESAINPDSPRAGEVDVHVAKNRSGKPGVATLADQLYCGCFENLPERIY